MARKTRCPDCAAVVERIHSGDLLEFRWSGDTPYLAPHKCPTPRRPSVRPGGERKIVQGLKFGLWTMLVFCAFRYAQGLIR